MTTNKHAKIKDIFLMKETKIRLPTSKSITKSKSRVNVAKLV